MIGDAPLSKSTRVPGWHTTSEEDALIQLVRQYVPDNGVIVEIGTEYGRTTAEFAYACQGKENIKIVTVDLFPDDHHIAAQHGGLLAVWRTNLQEAGIQNYDNVYFLPTRGDSGEIGGNWNAPVDLLFIDGDHTYEGVKRDIEAWAHHVKAGGIIIYHDYAKSPDAHPLHFEVKRAVDEWYDKRTEKLERIELPDSLIAFKKFESVKNDRNDEQANTTSVESSASTDKPAKKTRAAKIPTTPKGSKRTKGIKS